MTIEEALEQLEQGIRRLKVQYDMFFAGSLQRQPFDLRRQVDHMVRTLSSAQIRKYQLRFQLNTLVGRYNMLCELWGKHLRAAEEGRRFAGAAPLAAAPPSASKGGDGRPEDEQIFCTVQVSDPESEGDTMKTLYEHYLEARQSIKGGRPALKLESFVKQIASQASTLKQSSGCKTIEFRVLRKGDAVSLKARVSTRE